MSRGFTHEATYNESKEWYTPRFIFDKLGINFDLDPCSPGKNIVPWIPAKTHYTVKDNGLIKKWFGNVFINPPYGMDTPKWMKRLAEYGNGVALVFARPDTKWFHDYVIKADAICFIKGRVAFVPAEDALLYADKQKEPKGGCGAASMLVAFGKKNAQALFDSDLGLALSVSRPTVDGQGGGRFADVTAHPHENPPPNAEPGRAINYYIKKYKRKKK